MTTIVAGLGLRFAVSDWLETSDGEPTFLEVNPSGKWLFLRGATPAVPQAVAELLCHE